MESSHCSDVKCPHLTQTFMGEKKEGNLIDNGETKATSIMKRMWVSVIEILDTGLCLDLVGSECFKISGLLIDVCGGLPVSNDSIVAETEVG